MPSPCTHAGCPNLVDGGGKCEKHRKQVAKEYDRERGTAHQRGYTARWRRANRMYLKVHPLCECEECKSDNRIRPANVVHHKIPHKGNSVLFWDEENWQAMNKQCHDRHTARETGWGRGM